MNLKGSLHITRALVNYHILTMINFILNNDQINYTGYPDKSLLDYIRNNKRLTAAKDGCSGQGVCGACTVEINGEAKLACLIKMAKLNHAEVYTMEGFPTYVKETIAAAFVNKGAVQCGFCIPGMIVSSYALLSRDATDDPGRIRDAHAGNICRCTGYEKIVEAVQAAAEQWPDDTKEATS